MQHLIILPGNSSKNQAWGELMASHFGPQYDSVYLHIYQHWTSGEATIDFAFEEAALRAHMLSVPVGTEIVVFAKSAGSLLAFLALHHGVLTPVQCVFFGIPFDLAADNLFKNAWEPIDTFAIPALAFHNQKDPTTSYDYTVATLAAHAPHITLVTTTEHDHWYGDVETYQQYLV